MTEVCEETSYPDIDRVDLLHNCPKYFVSSLNEFLEVLQDYEITTRAKFVVLSSSKKFSEGSGMYNKCLIIFNNLSKARL